MFEIELGLFHRFSQNRAAFQLAVRNGNAAAACYFYKKLSQTERQESLFDTATSAIRI